MINAEDARRGFKYLAWKHGSEHAQNGHEVTTVHAYGETLSVHVDIGSPGSELAALNRRAFICHGCAKVIASGLAIVEHISR